MLNTIKYVAPCHYPFPFVIVCVQKCDNVIQLFTGSTAA